MEFTKLTWEYRPTDAHKGRPYYTRRAEHARGLYSRGAPCGRPLDSQSNSLMSIIGPYRL